MLQLKRCNAEVQILFVSDDESEVRQLASQLEKSAHRIAFKRLASEPRSIFTILKAISLERPFLPTAIVIDYYCNGGRCGDMIRDIRKIIQASGVEVIVANAPDGEQVRNELISLGADCVVEGNAGRHHQDRHASDFATGPQWSN